jgi:hypothetical protein
MKYLSKILVMFSCLSLKAQEISVTKDFLDKIALIESNGNPNAIGDNGLAIGLYQTHKPAWQDSVAYIKLFQPLLYDIGTSNGYFKDFKKDCLNEYYAEAITLAYFCILQKKYYEQFKKYPTQLQLYMMYNLGYHCASTCNFDPEYPLKTSARLAIKRAKLYLK